MEEQITELPSEVKDALDLGLVLGSNRGTREAQERPAPQVQHLFADWRPDPLTSCSTRRAPSR